MGKASSFLIPVFCFSCLVSFGQPQADFTVSDNAGCSPHTVMFTDMSTGNPTSYYWEFGDGATSVLKNPQNTYANPGLYTVKLTVTNINGSTTEIKTDYIQAYKNPVSNFTSNKHKVCKGDAVQLTDMSVDGDAAITTWHWDFGDGNNSSLKNPVHTFTQTGKYNITHVVTDGNLCTHTELKKVYIEVISVTADFSANETMFCTVPANVTFTNNSSPSSGLTYLWDFGDGNSSSLKSPAHTYVNYGEYDVKLKVTDSNSCFRELVKSDYIVVEKVNADFVYTMNDSCSPAQVTFTNKSTPSGVMYNDWTFGDNSTSTQLNPLHTYSSAGQYQVKLKVTKGQCNDEITKLITIYSAPNFNFSADTLLHCKVPFSVNFSHTAPTTCSYSWQFGNGQTSTLDSPAVWYSSFGSYDIKLTITSPEGCKKTVNKTAYIKAKSPVVIVMLDPIAGCKPLSVNYILRDSSLVKLTNWEVISGSGDTSDQKISSFIYPDVGIYNFEVKGSNNRGCQYYYTTTVAVGTPPQADFEDFTYVGCNDTFIRFKNLTNTHNPNADRFNWFFGDGGTSSLDTPEHKYVDTGYMTVTLVAFYNGCPDSFSRDSIIYIYAPVADLRSPLTGCVNDDLSNINQSIGGNEWFWDFGDGSYSTLEIPSHKYAAIGVYKIRLTVTDTISGCVDQDSGFVTIGRAPDDDFSANITESCNIVGITFTDTSTALISYQWDFGNGTSSTNKTPTCSYTAGGVYTVTLMVSDSVGCQSIIRKEEYIKISGFTTDLQVSPANGCVPLTVYAEDRTSAIFPIINRYWEMGNGENFNSFDADTSVTYLLIEPNKSQKSGYDINLTLTDSLNCTKTVTRKVYPSKPKPFLKYNVADLCQYSRVSLSSILHDTTVYDLKKIKWYVNNKLVSTSLTYTGNYFGDQHISAKVILQDKNGCIDSTQREFDVSTSPPLADFSYTIHSSANYCPPVIVDFIDKSIEGNKKIVAWYWDFGSTSYSNLQNPSNTYTEPGTYSVTLIVEDEVGCTDTLLEPDAVVVNGATGSFTVWPLAGCDSLTCQFTPVVHNAVSYSWNFGDGSVSYDLIPVHTFTYKGSFRPLILLTDSLGCKTTFPSPDTVYVYNSPVVDFHLDSKLTCLGKTALFHNSSNHEQQIIKWEWNFGNGVLSNQYEPSYKYSDTGVFDVSLLAIDDKGCRDSMLQKAALVIYLDTSNPKPSELYRITHIADPILDEVLFEANTEDDFRCYNLIRSDIGQSPYNKRIISDFSDTLMNDTLFAVLIPQCYFIITEDYCDNESEPGGIHCLIHLSASGKKEGNLLTWSPYIGWSVIDFYEIYRKKFNSPDAFERIAVVPDSTLSYLDTNVNCSDSYLYQVKALEKGGSLQYSYSNNDSARAVKLMLPPPARLIRVSVENEHVLVEWNKTDLPYEFNYVLYRSPDNKNFSEIGTYDSEDTSCIDQQVYTDLFSYYYHLRLKHATCYFLGKPSNIGRTILLEVDTTKDDATMLLSWNDYVYWAEGVSHYNIEYSQFGPSALIKIDEHNRDTNLYYHQCDGYTLDHYYRVQALQSDNPSVLSNSNIVKKSIKPRATIPNIFTPNDDQLNDFFEVVCYGCRVSSMQIFNRWGELLFEGFNEEARWDGKFRNEICPLGVYYYNIEVTTEKSTQFYYGTVTILR
ncbi:PKD domain-containing protein [Bacteroidota bacterium]